MIYEPESFRDPLSLQSLDTNIYFTYTHGLNYYGGLCMSRLLAFVLFLAPLALFGKIIEIDSLAPLWQEVSTASPKTLVLFDVDETLIIPEDQILRSSATDYRNKLLWPYEKKISEKSLIEELHSIVFLARKPLIINPHSLPLIGAFQNKNCKVIALTAMNTGKFGYIPRLEEWRANELKSLGFNFTAAFPQLSEIHFQEYQQITYPPIFYQGVLCSADVSKGEALKAFLEQSGFKPDHVIFVDDLFVQLKSVESTLAALNIPFTGYHYLEASKLPGEVNEEVVRLQFDHLYNQKEWLTDAQALKRLRT